MKTFLALILSSASVLASDPSPPVPEEFRPLYQTLEENLRQATHLYPIEKGDGPLVAPSLSLAASVFSPSASDAQRWKDLLATLDAFKAMGMSAVLVQIMAPDLAEDDTGTLVQFYQRLAGEIWNISLIYPSDPTGALVHAPMEGQNPSRI
jgi:hypothetical protein